MARINLDGKVALITGSTRGIGKAVAYDLAAHGARVIISGRDQDACDGVAADLNSSFGAGTAIGVAANISSRNAIESLVERSLMLGPIDILVCNAASNPYYGPMGGISDGQFQKLFQNNILSNHWLISLVAPGMRARGAGSIILMSSIGGFVGTRFIGAYNMTKAALLQLARNLAVEFGADGVRVNCIAPGVIRTDFARALWEDNVQTARVEAATPLARLGEPKDISGAAVFLASDWSRFMTGQAMIIDGGATVKASVAE